MLRSRALLVALVAVCALWCSQPFWPGVRAGQDLVPYLVQGGFVGVRDDLVFLPAGAGYGDLPPEVLAAQCDALLEGVDARTTPEAFAAERADCKVVAAPAVAPPVALPMWVAAAHLGVGGANAFVRLLGALCFVVGTAVLWRRLARHGDAGRLSVVLTALALTPLVLRTGELTQSAPLLFLSAVLAPGATAAAGRRRDVATSLVWSAAVLVKGFPVLLAGLLAYRSRWRSLAILGATLTAAMAATVLLVPSSVLGRYRDALDSLLESSLRVSTNRSAAALVASATDVSPALALGLTALVLGAATLTWWRRLRSAGAEVEWAWWSLAVVVSMPVLWLHYTPVAVAALGSALAHRPVPAESPTMLDRRLLLLPGLAMVLSLLAMPAPTGEVASWFVRAVTYGVLVAVLAGIARTAPSNDASRMS